MTYYVMKISNGHLQLNIAEGDVVETTDKNAAIVAFFNTCATYWNEPSVITGYVFIMDSQGDIVDDYKEFIYHPQTETNSPVAG